MRDSKSVIHKPTGQRTLIRDLPTSYLNDLLDCLGQKEIIDDGTESITDDFRLRIEIELLLRSKGIAFTP